MQNTGTAGPADGHGRGDLVERDSGEQVRHVGR
jgi:hypothetical protein